MSRLVCGMGFNDKTRPSNVDGKNVKEYNLWKNMLFTLICDGVKIMFVIDKL